MKYHGGKTIHIKCWNLYNILRLVPQFTQMLNLKTGVPAGVMYPHVGHGVQIRNWCMFSNLNWISYKHIKVIFENTTAIQCINKMGISRSMERHHQLLKIWEWEITHKNHLSAACIPGKLNTVPDKKSRSSRVDTKWMPQSKFLNLESENVYFKPEIDLFATNINAKFSK